MELLQETGARKKRTNFPKEKRNSLGKSLDPKPTVLSPYKTEMEHLFNCSSDAFRQKNKMLKQVYGKNIFDIPTESVVNTSLPLLKVRDIIFC